MKDIIKIFEDHWGKIAALIMFFVAAWFIKNGGQQLATALGMAGMTLLMPNDKGRKAKKEVEKAKETVDKVGDEVRKVREENDKLYKEIEKKRDETVMSAPELADAFNDLLARIGSNSEQ